LKHDGETLINSMLTNFCRKQKKNVIDAICADQQFVHIRSYFCAVKLF